MALNIQGVDQEYKPWGGLAGVATGERRAEMELANIQGLQEQNLSNVLKEVEARRAQSDYSTPGMEEMRQKGIMGKGMQDYATGKLSYDTLDSNTKTKLAENMSKASAAEVESTINGLEMFITGASSGQGGIGMQQALASLPPQYQQIVQKLEQQQPGSSVEYAKQFLDVIKQTRANSVAVRGKIMEQNNQYENQERIHIGDRESREKVSAADNASKMAIEKAGIEAGKYKRGGAGTSITTVFAKMTPEARLGAVQKALATGVDPETGELMTDMARKGYESMYDQDKRTVDSKNASKSVAKIDIPALANVPQATPPSVGTSGTPSNSPAKKVWDPATKTWITK